MKSAFAPVPAPCQIPSSIEAWSLVDAHIHRTNLHLKGKWMSKACGWKLFFRNQRRHSVIHRRDASWSIRGQRNPERRHGRPRSVQGRRNPEHRDPLLKPVKMVFEFKLHKHGSGVCFASSSARRRGRQREKTTANSQHAVVREEFAIPTEKRQQQRTTAWATKQNKQFDWGRLY